MKIITFYLPQYHPIPENNLWWGDGFTEWHNVAQAKPRFLSHYQPHIPADLGFYDLRLRETRLAQANLAMHYGIDGFCYYHYWFNGRRVLGRPFDEVLRSGEPDFPFCLCWANENWTRVWDGAEKQVLIRQEYSEKDTIKHIEWLISIFSDPRYIKVNGKPLFVIYRPDKIPETEEFIECWRKRAQAAGFDDIYLCAVTSGLVECDDIELINLGFDALIDFQPNRNDFPPSFNPKEKLYDIARKIMPDSLYQSLKGAVSACKIVDYSMMVDHLISKDWPESYHKFPCVFPSWDNSSRRKTPTVIQNINPLKYQEWLKNALNRVSCYHETEHIVFINAWNEWAEGCHLEPDLRSGHQFLEATCKARINDG